MLHGVQHDDSGYTDPFRMHRITLAFDYYPIKNVAERRMPLSAGDNALKKATGSGMCNAANSGTPTGVGSLLS